MNKKFRFLTSLSPIIYEKSLIEMEKYINDILLGKPSTIWYLEHPDIYTIGRGASIPKLNFNIPIIQTTRGGKTTYHGPGIQMVYIMLPLKTYNFTVHDFLKFIEKWLQNTFKNIGIQTFPDPKNIGIWTKYNNKDIKLASIGIRIQKGISMHGFCIHRKPNMDHFKAIKPCGLEPNHIGSLQQIGVNLTQKELIQYLKNNLPNI